MWPASEFAARRATKIVDGETLTGWFTEDFTWAELGTLRSVERLPGLRPGSAAFDGVFGIMRLADLFGLIDGASDARQRPLGMVAELKHAHYFACAGLPLDELFAAEVHAAGWDRDAERLVVESFEPTVLEQVRSRGVPGSSVLLIDEHGSPADLLAEAGRERGELCLVPDARGITEVGGRWRERCQCAETSAARVGEQTRGVGAFVRTRGVHVDVAARERISRATVQGGYRPRGMGPMAGGVRPDYGERGGWGVRRSSRSRGLCAG